MPHEVAAVLGIDAAWTDGQPSGVALLQRHSRKWRCLRLAPSYAAFCNGFTWEDRVVGAPIDVPGLLDACRQRLGGAYPIVVAVDMPLATTSIHRRRVADDSVSRQFGHRKCSVHSPTARIPGATGRRLQDGFSKAGYVLATKLDRHTPTLLEVYPHVALLGLLGIGERVPYKVGRTNTYWRGTSAERRKRLLIESWGVILDRLGDRIDDIDLQFTDGHGRSFKYLKRIEDAIDGLICAWVATEFIDNSAVPLGSGEAAIWIPSSAMQFAKDPHGT